jgi:hypothetical protein
VSQEAGGLATLSELFAKDAVSDIANAISFVLHEGKVVEGREYFEDTGTADEFRA